MEFARVNRGAGPLLQLETVEGIAARMAELVQLGMPLDYFDRYTAGVLGVSSPAVVEAARRHIDPARTVIVVVGDMTVLEPRLRALGVGPVVVVGER